MGSSDSSLNGKSFHDEYLLGRELGRGTFARVRAALRVVDGKTSTNASTTDNAECAVKMIDLRGDLKDKKQPCSSCDTVKTSRSRARMEETIWKIVGSHSNCVHMHEVFFESSMCYMVMEKCNSSLWHHLEQSPDLTERFMGTIFHQMLQGIAHVHSVHIVHRDVKPSNFMVGGDDHQTVKLGDFGLSASLLASDVLSGECGTAPFISPEMLNGAYDEKTDMWSMGVLAYALLFGEYPYMPLCDSCDTCEDIKRATVDGFPPTFAPRHHSTEAWTIDDAKLRTENAIMFVKALLQRDPEHRPSAQESLAMAYMHEVDMRCHAHGVELPSLLPALLSAKKLGVFETCRSNMGSGMNSLLTAQQQKHGQPSPAPMSAQTPSFGTNENATENQAHLKVSFTAGVDSHAPDEVECISNDSTFCSSGGTETIHSHDIDTQLLKVTTDECAIGLQLAASDSPKLEPRLQTHVMTLPTEEQSDEGAMGRAVEDVQSNIVHPDVGTVTRATTPSALKDDDQDKAPVMEFLCPSALTPPPSSSWVFW